MYRYSYPSTHGISGQVAVGDGEIGGEPEDDARMNLEMHFKDMIVLTWNMHYVPEIE